jgi:Cd2+/Zn2+-exporting ATPase
MRERRSDPAESDGCGCGCRSDGDAEGPGARPSGALRPDGDDARQVEFRIEDMDCASCLATIRGALTDRPGVLASEGSPISRRLLVTYDGSLTDPETVRRSISDLGYRALHADETSEAPGVGAWRSRRALLTYLAGGLYSLGLATRLATGRGLTEHAHGFGTPPGPDGLLFLLAAAIGAWNFLPKALGALRARRLDMHVLMALAVIGAVAIGEYMEAAAIAFLFSLAELLESFAIERANASVRSLMELSPDVATVRRDGREVTVPASEVRAGEEVLVRPGERIPVDGVVTDGVSAVNEAPITGEGVPADRGPGDEVFAGSIVQEGFLRIRTSRDAEDTTLARMIRLVEEAERRRAPSERFVERFARVYTPVVTVAAALVVVVPVLVFGAPFETWLLRGLTLLVIACPCALVISTPVSVVSAVTSAARNGVLIKGGDSLERMGEVRAMAFDKSGTLTHGRAELVEILSLDGTKEDVALGVAAAAEARSEHPLGRAIVRAARTRGMRPESMPVEEFVSMPGKGVRARVGGERYVVGRSTLLPEPGRIPALARMAEEGRTTVLLARDPDGNGGRLEPVAVLALADEPRPLVQGVFEQLRAEGIRRIVLLSGDQGAAVEAVGEAVGADEVRSRLDPAEKVYAVREVEEEWGRAAMVGDGVNDAPALAAASVGIALGAAASDAALETADIALMGDDLGRLPYLVRLSRMSRRVIRQNIAAAILLKAVLALGVPLGAVSLIVAVLVGDMGASLAVTTNALRLARVAPRDGPAEA